MARKLLSDAVASKLARQQEEGVETPMVLPRRKAEKLPKSFERTRNEFRGKVARDDGFWVLGTLRPW
jgi:hypothetical protein